jgi:hypothetical protein
MTAWVLSLDLCTYGRVRFSFLFYCCFGLMSEAGILRHGPLWALYMEGVLSTLRYEIIYGVFRLHLFS